MKITCEHVSERLHDLHDGLCQPAEEQGLREHLASCQACRQLHEQTSLLLGTLDALPSPEPSPLLRARFEQMLENEVAAEAASPGKTEGRRARQAARTLLPGAWLQVAAAACLLLTGLAGGALLFRTPAADQSTQAETQRRLAELQQRVDSMNSLLAQSLSQGAPDHVRLQRVADLNLAGEQPGGIASLLGSLALDPSTNVRLSALEALYPHAGKPIVREGVAAALARENSPLVQLAMVDFLSSLDEATARKAVEALGRNPNNTEALRRSAREALGNVQF